MHFILKYIQNIIIQEFLGVQGIKYVNMVLKGKVKWDWGIDMKTQSSKIQRISSEVVLSGFFGY